MKNSQTLIGQQWKVFLSSLLTEYKAECPDDTRSDKEILTDLMEYWTQEGLIKKSGGKYILGKLTYDA